MSSPEHPDTGRDRRGDVTPGDGPPRFTRFVRDLHGRLTVLLTESGRHTQAAVTGEIDHACAPTLDHVLHDSLRRSAQAVDLDLSAVTFFDCGGLNALLRARSLAERNGAVLTVTAASSAVERLLVLTGTRAALLPGGARPGPQPPLPGSCHHAA